MNTCKTCRYFRSSMELPVGAGTCFLRPPSVHMVMVPMPEHRNPLMVPAAEVKNAPTFVPQAAMQRPVVMMDDFCESYVYRNDSKTMPGIVDFSKPTGVNAPNAGPVVTR